MKKAKRITAAVMAAAMMISTIPTTANALYIPSDDSYLEGFTKVERGQYSFLESTYAYHNNEVAETYFVPGAEVYLSNTDTRMIVRNVAYYNLACKLTEGTTAERIAGLMDKTDVEYNIRTFADETQFWIRITDTSIGNADLRRIADILSDSVTEIKVWFESGGMEFGYRSESIADDYLTFFETDADKAEEYLTEKGISFITERSEKEFSDPAVKLIPETEMTQWKKAAMFDEIINNKEISFIGYGWTQPAELGATASEIIDIIGKIDGDANCDDKLTVSDAVAVLQYIANKEKYPLTAQAEFNADIDGEEGITGGDAISIQRIDAGISDIDA